MLATADRSFRPAGLTSAPRPCRHPSGVLRLVIRKLLCVRAVSRSGDAREAFMRHRLRRMLSVPVLVAVGVVGQPPVAGAGGPSAASDRTPAASPCSVNAANLTVGGGCTVLGRLPGGRSHGQVGLDRLRGALASAPSSGFGRPTPDGARRQRRQRLLAAARGTGRRRLLRRALRARTQRAARGRAGDLHPLLARDAPHHVLLVVAAVPLRSRDAALAGGRPDEAG